MRFKAVEEPGMTVLGPFLPCVDMSLLSQRFLSDGLVTTLTARASRISIRVLDFSCARPNHVHGCEGDSPTSLFTESSA